MKYPLSYTEGRKTQVDVEPGKPEQFCTSAEKLGDAPLVVAPYPVAWRIEVVDNDKHRGFEYVRSGLVVTRWNEAVH